MIKVCRFFYIHWLFLLLAVLCYIAGRLEMLVINYCIMVVHELAHLAAAKFIGLSVSHITLYPFGVNLKLKNTMLYSVSDEIILYMSGPLTNALAALAIVPFMNDSAFLYELYIKNIALFIINILPIMPLDGGMTLKKILNYKLGYRTATVFMKVISTVMLFCFTLFLLYALYKNEFNVSMCIFALFLVGNVFMSKEKYNYDFIKELTCNRKKSKMQVYKAKIIGAKKGTGLVEIAKEFNFSSNYFVMLVNDKNHCVDIMSEEEVISKVLEEKVPPQYADSTEKIFDKK